MKENCEHQTGSTISNVRRKLQRPGLAKFRRAGRIVIILLRAGGLLNTENHDTIDPVALTYRKFANTLV